VLHIVYHYLLSDDMLSLSFFLPCHPMSLYYSNPLKYIFLILRGRLVQFHNSATHLYSNCDLLIANKWTIFQIGIFCLNEIDKHIACRRNHFKNFQKTHHHHYHQSYLIPFIVCQWHNSGTGSSQKNSDEKENEKWLKFSVMNWALFSLPCPK